MFSTSLAGEILRTPITTVLLGLDGEALRINVYKKVNMLKTEENAGCSAIAKGRK